MICTVKIYNEPHMNDAADSAEAQAEYWLIKQDAEPDNPELNVAFNLWYQQSAENREAYANAELLWQMLGQLPDMAVEKSAPSPGTVISMPLHSRLKADPDDPNESIKSLASVRTEKKHASFLKLALGLAASVMLVAGLVSWQQWNSSDYYSDTGEQVAITLEDESRVLLNTDTRIDLEYSSKQRTLILHQGEALFTVAKDPRPFVVRLNNTEVEALGTVFTVGQHQNTQWVSVTESQVELSTPGQRYKLSAGQYLLIKDGQPGKVENMRPDHISPWQKGLLIARNKPAAELISQLDRYYPGEIVLLNTDIGDKRMNTVLNIREPEQALSGLALSLKLQQLSLGPVTLLY